MHQEPSLIPNFTLLIQLGIFLVSWLVLHILVFKPYVALIEARRNKTTGLVEKAAKAKSRAVQLQAQYEQLMKEERKKVTTWTDAERKKVGDAERDVISAARDEVASDLQTLRAKLQADYDKARKDLLPQVGEYSSHIVSKLVGYTVKVPATVELKKGHGGIDGERLMNTVVASSIVNFLAVVFILWFFCRKPMAAFLISRSEAVANAIKEAEAQSREADAVLRTSQTNWDSAEAHAKAQLDDAKKAMVRYRESALASAKAEAERVKKESRMVGNSEAYKARQALQKEMVEKSVQMAESYLTGHLSEKDKQKLVSEYVEIVRNGAV